MLLFFPREGITPLFSCLLECTAPLFSRAFSSRDVRLSEKDD
jgi:hypothetical protein